jgi:phage-related protein
VRKILFYRTGSGQCPDEDFLDSLDGKQAQKVTWVLQLVEEVDRLSGQYFKKLVNTDDIWEVRVQVGSNIFRLLGFFDGDNLVVLAHGFQKKTQKTPAGEIALAEARKRDYLKRRRHHE